MPDVINDIKRKYNVSDTDAHVIYDASLHTGKNLHSVAMLYKTLPKSEDKNMMTRRLFNAIQSSNMGKLEARRKIYGDDLRTKFVTQGFALAPEGTPHLGKKGVFGSEGVRERITDIEEDEKTGKKIKTLMTPQRGISVSKRLTAVTPQDEIYRETARARNVPPKYFYFDIDGRFNDRGYTEPPRNDAQFKGWHDYIPYARTTVVRVISPSKYEVPQLDDAGNFIVDSQGQLIKAKTPGYKQMFVEFFMLGKPVKSYMVRVPYSYRAEADIIQSVETSRKVRAEIASLINKDIYNSLQPGRKKESLIEDIITIKGPKGEKITSLSQIADKVEREQHEKDLARLKYLEYYGEPEKEERKKKKSAKRPAPKRKKIVKVKPKRKCICKPIIRHKKVTAKKKMIKRRK